MRRFLLLSVVVACLALAERGHEAPVSVVIRKRIVMPKETFAAVWRVQPHEANRLLIRAVESDNGYGTSSDEGLPGADAPLTRTLFYEFRVPGRYMFIATLVRQDGSTQRALETVCVVGGEQGCED